MTQKVVLAPSPTAAYQYMHVKQPGVPKYIYADRATDLEGVCPAEVHVVAGAHAHPRHAEIMEHLLACEAKMPLRSLWWLNGRLVNRGVALNYLRVRSIR